MLVTVRCDGASWARIIWARPRRTRNSCFACDNIQATDSDGSISSCPITSIIQSNWNWCARCAPRLRMGTGGCE